VGVFFLNTVYISVSLDERVRDYLAIAMSYRQANWSRALQVHDSLVAGQPTLF